MLFVVARCTVILDVFYLFRVEHHSIYPHNYMKAPLPAFTIS